jgi:hypothetical protein
MSGFAIIFLVFAILLAILAIVCLVVSFENTDLVTPFLICGAISAVLFFAAFNVDNDVVVKKFATKEKPTEILHSKYEVIVYFNKDMYRYNEAKQVNLINDSTIFAFHWDIQKDGDTNFNHCEPILIEN